MTDAPILLVEDNPDDVELTIRALRRSDIPNEVVVAADGEQALHLLSGAGTAPLRPALVLLDVNLPRVDGLEVLRRIKGDAATRMVPVVVLTTSNEECDIVDSYRLGANSFIRKPVSFTEFVSATRVLGRYWLELNQPAPAQRAAP
ncbi:MAG TPA: response regulator [Pilimelia sp.]|nr:response regulator [Pilimelia sp.]